MMMSLGRESLQTDPGPHQIDSTLVEKRYGQVECPWSDYNEALRTRYSATWAKSRGISRSVIVLVVRKQDKREQNQELRENLVC